MLPYDRIALSLQYIREHFHEQPDLDTMAAAAFMSPHHFQKLFSDWAGVSPKKFLQFLTAEYLKDVLKQQDISLERAGDQAGLSTGSRVHDLFIHLEGMTPGEYKQGGKGILIRYSLQDSIWGRFLVASTPRGICQLQFLRDNGQAAALLKAAYPLADIVEETTEEHHTVTDILNGKNTGEGKITLHLRGTPFQLKVWQALLQIPEGVVSSYGDIATRIGQPTASRAVGTAIGSNPVGYLIPCHRVIRNMGIIGEYRWGSERKLAMLGLEAARRHK